MNPPDLAPTDAAPCTKTPAGPRAVKVNQSWRVPPEGDGLTLLQWLRADLDLAAAQPACDTGHCGNCAVRIDGVPTKACTVLLEAGPPGHVETLEGFLLQPGRLQPLVRALDAPSVFQCGYCKPAFFFAAAALLERNPDPDRQAIQAAFDGLLCRCTGYQSIIEAVASAAAALRRPARSGQDDAAAPRPRTVAEAVEQAQRLPGAAWLAGGQQLVPMAQKEGGRTEPLISLDEIATLRDIATREDWLHVGAGCTHDDLARSDTVARHVPALAQLAGQVGDVYLRGRGTLGGALAGAPRSSCYPSFLLAAEARVRTAEGCVPMAQWLHAATSPSPCGAASLLVGVDIPIPLHAAHRNFRPRPGRPAAMSVSAVRDRQGCLRIAVTGYSDIPFRVAEPERLLATLLEAPASGVPLLGLGAEPAGDAPAAAYRRGLLAHLLRQLARDIAAWPGP